MTGAETGIAGERGSAGQSADQWQTKSTVEPGPLWREVSAGVDATPHVWLVYSGATIALSGSDVWSEGWRIRAGGGYGGYTYAAPLVASGSLQAYRAQTSFADGLVGYLKRFGPLTAKAFVGAAVVTHRISPADPFATSALKWGPKAALELWLNIGDSAWSSLDVSATTAFETTSAHLRLGYRVLPTVSVGLEAAVNHGAVFTNAPCTAGATAKPLFNGRAGAFVRYEWFGGEIAAAGGLATDFDSCLNAQSNSLEKALRDNAFYANLNWVTQF